MKVINLDHISAKPLLPEVKAVMIGAIEKDYHNPSSQHKTGEEAAAALQKAREGVADLLNCRPTRIRASISLHPISSTMRLSAVCVDSSHLGLR
jgi:cysteine sulfinate desulfinase/cysteine desulfurase-like protein